MRVLQTLALPLGHVTIFGATVAAPYGAADEARTRYLHLGKVALYRMSYTRMGRALLYHKHRICQVLIFAFSGSFSIHPTVPAQPRAGHVPFN